ncbi:hypothetical protein D3C72_2573970 [compost metagenome]
MICDTATPASACSSSLPMVPSSPSTDSPTACAASTVRRVMATFSSYGSIEPSIITEVKPIWIAVSICS